MPIDFREYKGSLESNVLDDALLYLSSASIIESVPPFPVYKLSETAVDKYLEII